jgi:ribonuclease J
MKLLIHLVKPKHFVPIHGELRHLTQHAAIAREVGLPDDNIAVVENGTVLEFENDKLTVGERIPGGYVYVDGTGVGDIGPGVMRERETLAENGFVVVNLRLNKAGQLVGKPDIISRGFVFVRDAEELLESAQGEIARAVAKANSAERSANGGSLGDRVQSMLSDFFYAETKRRPMVFALVNQVG